MSQWKRNDNWGEDVTNGRMQCKNMNNSGLPRRFTVAMCDLERLHKGTKIVGCQRIWTMEWRVEDAQEKAGWLKEWWMENINHPNQRAICVRWCSQNRGWCNIRHISSVNTRKSILYHVVGSSTCVERPQLTPTWSKENHRAAPAYAGCMYHLWFLRKSQHPWHSGIFNS